MHCAYVIIGTNVVTAIVFTIFGRRWGKRVAEAAAKEARKLADRV